MFKWSVLVPSSKLIYLLEYLGGETPAVKKQNEFSRAAQGYKERDGQGSPAYGSVPAILGPPMGPKALWRPR